VQSGYLLCRSRASEQLHALDPETLETWASCADPEECVSLHEGLFCETTASRMLVLRDPGTGIELARVPEPEGSRHVHYRQSVCFFSTTERMAIDLGSGRALWRHPAVPHSGEATRVPMRWGDLAFASASGLAAFDLVTGEPRWRILEGRTDLRLCWRMVEGRLLLDTGSAVHVVDAATGGLVGSHDVGLTISTATLAAGGVVAVLGVAEGGDTELHILQVEPGAP